VSPEAAILRAAAEAVATKLDLPGDWLNDGAKGYLVGVTTGDVLYESATLTVRAASTPQLLAMKLAAWRDTIDREDAKLLLSHLNGSAEEIWSMLAPFVPAHQLDKASYAFEDLWEAVHGHP
jgi:predicted nucleotidyltransferase